MTNRYRADEIPQEYWHPEENVWLVPCWDEYHDIEVIEVPDGWPWPLPDLPDPLPAPPVGWVPSNPMPGL